MFVTYRSISTLSFNKCTSEEAAFGEEFQIPDDVVFSSSYHWKRDIDCSNYTYEVRCVF
jgi:hypothetical protein